MREYALLDHLASRAGEAVGADQILEHVWGQGYAGPDRVRTGVARLRAKLRAAFRPGHDRHGPGPWLPARRQDETIFIALTRRL